MALFTEIPEYLHKSELYQKLESEDQEEIDFQFLKPNIIINNIQDWIDLFNTCNYFNLEKYPETLTSYYFDHLLDINLTLDNIYDKDDPLVLLIKELVKSTFIKRIREYWTEFQFSLILANSHNKWDYFLLSSNPNITWDIVLSNPNFPWDYNQLSSNSNITWNIIKANPNHPWNCTLLSSNLNIT